MISRHVILPLATLLVAIFAGPTFADTPVEAAEFASKARPHAPEDAHWWLGQEIVPVSVRDQIAEAIAPSFVDQSPADELNVGHIFVAIVVFLIGISLALAARGRIKKSVLPPEKFGAAGFFDIFVEMLLNVMVSMMPRDRAIRFLPAVMAIGFFILISNLIGLVPGMLPPTQSLNTTLALGIFSFLYFTFQDIRERGLWGWLRNFMGPMIAIAPLMFVVELIAYCVRPVSLALRLMGNMFGDHQVIFIFMSFGIPLIPIPLIVLGILVCVVQTAVFTLLFIAYLSLTINEDAAEEQEAATLEGPGAIAQPA